MSKLHLVIGVQGSGKTTFSQKLKERLKEKTIIYEKDDCSGDYKKFVKILKKEIEIHKDYVNFIIVGTFLTIENRKLLLDTLKDIKTLEITCYYHNLNDTDFSNCQINVLRRGYKKYGKFFIDNTEIKEVKDIHIFPISALFSARKKYIIPTISEGFSDIINFSVHIPIFNSEIYKNKALILDYDGTLRSSKGDEVYPIKKEDIVILPKRKEKIKEYKDNGYIPLGISNQSGISSEKLTYEKASELFEETNKLLDIDIKVYFCPHRSFPITCYCRKPQTGNLIKMIEKYKLNIKDCIFVGDMKTDQTLSKKFNIPFIFAKDFF